MRKSSLAALALLVLPVCSHAVINDDFNDGNDTGWTRFNIFGAAASFSFPSGGYQMQSIASPNPGAFGPARLGSFRNDETFGTHFSLSIDIVNWNTTLQNQVMGVIGRATNVGGGTTNGYVAVVETDGNFYLVRTALEVPTTLSAAALPAALDINKDYRVTLTGVNDLLTATLFNITDNQSLLTISATDSSYTTGIGGILTFDSTGTAKQAINATYDNYASVPEPASVGMLMLGAVGLLGRRLRKTVA